MQVKTLSDGLLFSTVRIETLPAAGPATVSTGFIVEFQTADNKYPFLVTAKHVIRGAANGRITFIQEQRGQPSLGKGYTLEIENFEQLWFLHPEEDMDVAITPFVPFVKHIEDSGIPLYFCSVTPDMVLDPVRFQQLGVLDETIYAGYPTGISDEKNLLPLLSRGVAASPLSLDYNGRPQFIISGALYPGASGGPVYLIRGADAASRRLVLLGMLTSGFTAATSDTALQAVPIAEAFRPGLRVPASFAVVLKVFVILDLIHVYLREKGFA